MKPLLFGRCLVAILVAGLVPADAAPEEKPAPPNASPKPAQMIAIEAHFLRATDRQMRAAVKALSDDAKAPRAHVLAILSRESGEKATKALREAGAEFLSSPRLVTRSGQRAVVETVRELRYAVEGSPDKEGRTVPVAFETRDVGTTVEIEPVAGPSDDLDLNINATLVDFLGFIDPANISRKTGQSGADDLARALRAPLKAGGLWQPIFDTSKIVTNFKLQSGQMVILGGLAEKPATSDSSKPAAKASAKPEARLVYVLLTAEAVHP